MSKLKAQTTTRLTIKPIHIWLTSGILVAAAIWSVLLMDWLDTTPGTAKPIGVARYGFDIHAPELLNVNFTILENHINSNYDEARPFISADGKSLFFSRRKHPDNVYGARDRQDIWVAQRDDNGQWAQPINLGKGINTRGPDAMCSVNDDGTEIIIINDILFNEQPLMRSQLTEAGWSKPIPIRVENFYALSDYMDFYLSHTSNVILMAVKREDSVGDQDLYVSFPSEEGENEWSAPISLGKTINSKHADFAPFLSYDGKTLYFASYGHNGLGHSDIFKSTRLDDTWQNWSEPVNLGKGINSEREETYFTVTSDNQYIYFESYDPLNPVRDIFRADLNL